MAVLPAAVRFWLRVDKNGPVPEREPDLGRCWVWVKTGGSGYGTFSDKGKTYAAHRFAWQLSNGSIPHGLMVCHKCDRPSCCRPDHLFLGTNTDNVRDAIRKGRMRRRHGPRGASVLSPDRTYFERQTATIMDVIRKHRASTGRSPTYREIAASIGARSTGAIGLHIRVLEKAGLITRRHMMKRSIVPVSALMPPEAKP